MRERLKGVDHHLDAMADHALDQRQKVAEAAQDVEERRLLAHARLVEQTGVGGDRGGAAAGA